jgi:hypothetical protein
VVLSVAAKSFRFRYAFYTKSLHHTAPLCAVHNRAKRSAIHELSVVMLYAALVEVLPLRVMLSIQHTHIVNIPTQHIVWRH